MRKIFPLIIVLSMFSCGTKKENNSLASNSKDSMPTKEDVKVETKDKSNVMDVYQLLKAQTVKLDNDQSFEFPEIKEENGKFNIYDPAFDEPVNQAVLSSSKEKMEFTYGDYVVSVLKLAPCSNDNYISVVISNLMGNYSNYSLQVFKLVENNKLSNVTSEVFDSLEMNKSYNALKSIQGLAISDYQFALQEDGSLGVKLNESKLGPVYLKDNPEAAIGKTTEEQRKLNLIMNWSSSKCKYVIK